jgi:integrase
MPARGDLITKRKDGRYMARYTVQTPDGPKRKTIYGRQYKDVEQKLAKARGDAARGLVFDAGNLTVGEWAERWLRDAVADTVRPVTFAKYEQIVRNHIKPSLGRLKLTVLNPAHVRGLYREKLDRGLSPRTVQYIHVTLNKALKQAVADGLVPRNVCEAVKPSRPEKREISPLSPEQARRFLEACQGERLEALFVLAVHTGMRQGELLGLHWEDVDLEAGAIRVRRALSQTNDGPVLAAPKSAKSRRRIKLTGAAVEALKRHRAAQNAERLRLGGLWEDRGLVFPNRTGSLLSPYLLTDGPLERPLERAGLPPIRFHDLRHTCATILLSRGVHAKLVQELLGHATISITLDTYSHVLPGMDDGLADAMGDALG